MQRGGRAQPKNAAALNYLGYTYAEMGVRLDEAESLIRRALDIDPTTASTSTASAGCTHQRGDYREAISSSSAPSRSRTTTRR
jgi:Flp pilus assembly protein TadD